MRTWSALALTRHGVTERSGMTEAFSTCGYRTLETWCVGEGRHFQLCLVFVQSPLVASGYHVEPHNGSRRLGTADAGQNFSFE